MTVLEKEGCLCKFHSLCTRDDNIQLFKLSLVIFQPIFIVNIYPSIWLFIYLSIYLYVHTRARNHTHMYVSIYIYTYILIRTHCTWVLTTQIIWNADNYEMFNNTCGYMNYTLTIQVLIIAAEQWWAGVSGTMCNIISFICVK